MKLFKSFILSILFSTAVIPSINAEIYSVNTGYDFTVRQLSYDDFDLHVWSPEWQPRVYYSGVFSSSIGYFYVSHLKDDVSLYGSNRYLSEDNLEKFYQSLHPLKENLLPYATPNGCSVIDYHIQSEEETCISNLPAKKIIFEANLSDGSTEMIVSYIFTKIKRGLFSDSFMGYTYSASCPQASYEEAEMTRLCHLLTIE